MNWVFKIAALGSPLLALGLCGCGLIGPLVGAALPYAGAKMYFACIPERTAIDTPSGPRPIEVLQPGDSVVGYGGDAVRILQKHSFLENPQTVFLSISFDDGSKVELCRMHRLAGIPARQIYVGQSIAGRQVTKVETRQGETRSYDLLTEDRGYRIQGIPVNSMIEEMHLATAASLRAVRP